MSGTLKEYQFEMWGWIEKRAKEILVFSDFVIVRLQ